jgi:hypothetical protein
MEPSRFKKVFHIPADSFLYGHIKKNRPYSDFKKYLGRPAASPGILSIPNLKLSRMHNRAYLPQQISGRLPPLIPGKLLACIEELTFNDPNLIQQE